MKKFLMVGALALACAWVSRPTGAVEKEECSACELAAKMCVPNLESYADWE